MDPESHKSDDESAEFRTKTHDAALEAAIAIGTQQAISRLLAEGPVADVLAAGAPPALGLIAAASAYGVRRFRRGRQLLAAAAAEGNEEPETLSDRILASENSINLFERVLDAAASTRLQAKIHTLAAVVRMAVDQPERLDEAHLLAEALDTIEKPHLLIMKELQQAQIQHGRDRDPDLDQTSSSYHFAGLDRHQLSLRLPAYSTAVLEPLLSALARAGLTRNPGSTWMQLRGGDPSAALTEFGELCLMMLLNAPPAPES